MSGLDGLGWPNPEDEPKSTKSMSDTPETDGEWNRIACYDHPQFEQGIAEFARKLERERDEAWEQRDAVTLRLGETQERMIDAERQRDKLAEAVNAATVLIAAKGRHNTMLAYEGLRKALATTNQPNL
jgi:hypothetical protein